MQVIQASVGSRGIDTITSIDVVHAQALKQKGVDFVIRYLGGLTPTERDCILAAGLGLMVCTYASAHDGNAAVAAMKALNLPVGTTCWYDLEGMAAYKADPTELQAQLNDFATALLSAGYAPKLYVGSPQPLTSSELWGLKFVGYWHGAGSCRDRNGELAEPAGGWMMIQANQSCWIGGVWSDADLITSDYRQRVPSLVVA